MPKNICTKKFPTKKKLPKKNFWRKKFLTKKKLLKIKKKFAKQIFSTFSSTLSLNLKSFQAYQDCWTTFEDIFCKKNGGGNWGKLFGGTVPPNNTLFGGIPNSDKEYLIVQLGLDQSLTLKSLSTIHPTTPTTHRTNFLKGFRPSRSLIFDM